jgi:hypothetical protein
LIGGNLGLQVVQIVGETPCATATGVCGRFVIQELNYAFFIKFTLGDKLLGLDSCSFLVKLP